MQLSMRLSAIAQMVSRGSRLVDVGCDHGYLPIWLILQSVIPSAIAMDVRTGPLERAREHIEQAQLAEYIELRLSDGLQKLTPGEGDTLVIAGMGGPLMERILREGQALLPGFQELILQPQSDVPHFRRFLRMSGWEIVREEMVCEDGKYYPMMRAVKMPEGYREEWSVEDYLFGKHLLGCRRLVLKSYLERELRIREKILEKLGRAPDERAALRKAEVLHEKEQLLHTLQRWEKPDGSEEETCVFLSQKDGLEG